MTDHTHDTPPPEEQTSIQDLILEQEDASQIIKNASLLDPNEIVDEDRIVGRDEQLTEIAQQLRITIRGDRPPNLLLYGPSGTGKSLILKAVCNNIKTLCKQRDISLGIIEINCQPINSLDDAVWELIKQVTLDVPAADIQVPEHGISTKKKWDELYRLIDTHYDTCIFILDELDLLVGKRRKDEPAFSRILYQLSRTTNLTHISTNVSVSAITNDTKLMEDVNSRAESSFYPTDVNFPDYDAEQLREILNHRRDAFYDDTLSNDVIPLAAAFAAQTHGDARKAIDLMREAGNIAERNVEETVEEKHVRAAQDRVEKNRVLEVARGISAQKKYCLFATAIVALESAEEAAKSSDAYTVYQYVTSTAGAEQYAQETYVNKMKELTTYSLVECERKSKGPTSGSYLEFSFTDDADTIYETLREEEARLGDLDTNELRVVVNAQMRN